jgi:hypothetical protein
MFATDRDRARRRSRVFEVVRLPLDAECVVERGNLPDMWRCEWTAEHLDTSGLILG